MAQRLHLKKEPRLDAKLKAFAYQAEAVDAIRDLDYAAIFHEQGLGKTKIAIDLALHWLDKKSVDTVLFVVKKSLLHNWERELALHSHVKPRILSQNRRSNFYVFNSPARIALAHFEVLQSEHERLRLFMRARDVGLILDESAKIKNPASALTKSVLSLRDEAKRRVIMTGTPVANRPYDIWSQIYFLDGGESLGNDFTSFKAEMDLSNDLSGDELAQERFETALGTVFGKISSFCVRETKDSGVISLPEKEVRSVVADWESKQLDLYRRVRDEMRVVVVREGRLTEDNSEAILKRLLRLVQIASNPGLVDASYASIPGKLPVLTDLVARIAAAGEKCIIWTGFTENADWLAHELRGTGARRVHGKMAIDSRNRAITKFLSDDTTRVLVATPGAAKEGLTLTVANHVIFYDRSFSLDDYLQAQDRIHRISQAKKCFVYNILMTDSIDRWVDVLLTAKRAAAQLAQGDISLDCYKQQMTYDFGEILKDVLGIDDEERLEK